MEIYTIGFAGKTAEQFFEPLAGAGVQELVDVRLNNVSQLAGFTKRHDLPYLLAKIAGIAYRHELLLAPPDLLLKGYRRHEIGWPEYEQGYKAILIERRAGEVLRPDEFADRIAFLCSEPEAATCHRRLAAEYLQSCWPGVSIQHL